MERQQWHTPAKSIQWFYGFMLLRKKTHHAMDGSGIWPVSAWKRTRSWLEKDRFLTCIAQPIGQPCLHGRTELHEKSSGYACMAGQISTLLLLFAIQSEIWQSRLNPFALHTHVRSRQADRNRTAYYCLFKSAGRSERGWWNGRWWFIRFGWKCPPLDRVQRQIYFIGFLESGMRSMCTIASRNGRDHRNV